MANGSGATQAVSMHLQVEFLAAALTTDASALGIVLLAVGAALLVAEAHLASHGVLGSAAAAALTAGVVFVLLDAGAPSAAIVATGVIVGVVAFVLAWLLLVQSLAARRLTVRSGQRALLGRTATVRVAPGPIGQVQLDGALWRARLSELDDEGGPVAEGATVVVESIDGLTLTVRTANEWEVH